MYFGGLTEDPQLIHMVEGLAKLLYRLGIIPRQSFAVNFIIKPKSNAALKY